MLAHELVEAADAVTHDDARALRRVSVHTGVRERLLRRGEGEENVPVELPEILRARQTLGVEVLHLAGDANGELGRVERADVVDAAAPGDQSSPRGGHVVTQWGHGPDAGDRNSPHSLVPWTTRRPRGFHRPTQKPSRSETLAIVGVHLTSDGC